ncbi:Fatty acyl-CoA synthetase A, partial [Smittium culicis]
MRNPSTKEPFDFLNIDKNMTVYHIFTKSSEETPNNKFLGHRPYNRKTKTFMPYVFQTYSQVAERATNFGAGIIYLRFIIFQRFCMCPETSFEVLKRNWPVAIYSLNRPEWTIADKGLNTQSLYSVALYDTLGSDSMEYILNHCEAPIVVCSLDKVPKILSNIHNLKYLQAIVCMDRLHPRDDDEYGLPYPFNVSSVNVLLQWAKSKNVILFDMYQIEKMGLENPIEHHPPKPSDIYTIMYTSGTTGNPKGAVTTHSNYAYAADISSKFGSKHRNTPSIVSFLPLAHAYGRTRENTITLQNGFIGYYCGDITKILEDTRQLQPTSFTGVPRLLTRFYDAISASTINSPNPIIRKVSQMGAKIKIANLHSKKIYDNYLFDLLIFNKTKAILSSKLENISTGTAPVEPYVTDFLRVSLKAVISEGYAMTETASVGSRQPEGDFSNGNVGTPGQMVEFRLRDVPEMQYLSSDSPCPRGELLMRSPTVFSGYLKNVEATEETLIEDRWLASGDIAQFNEDGSVSIIDRKKSLFKLSQGEYISPEKVEVVITQDPLVMQAF